VTMLPLTFTLCLLCLSNAWADSDWSKTSVTDGITLYTRDASDTPIKEVKTVMTVKGTLSGITKLIMDAEVTPDWVYGVEKTEVLKSDGSQNVLIRNVIGLPWPLDDRDAINEMRVSQDADNKRVTIEMINQPDALATVDGLVRMAVASGHWTLSPLADGKIKVAQVYKADPGGKVPEWVINMFVLEGPVATFKSMQKILQEPAYQSGNQNLVSD
jgi:hypothetical protein